MQQIPSDLLLNDFSDFEEDELVVAWRNVSYFVTGGRQILDNVSGVVYGGQVHAILGPSGSGKTSLLNAIAGRVPLEKGATLEGELSTPSSETAYVTQDDALFTLSTVRECFDFVARLRCPELSPTARKVRINEVISELNLRPCADTMIGGSLTVGEVRGISGGERKRCHIGTDLLHRPKIIFLDEPTSGLDSFQALSLVQTLRSLSRGLQQDQVGGNSRTSSTKRVIVASLHQPRSAIYNAGLDTVCVLAAGGRVAFFGSQANGAAHFAKAGFPIPSSFNPADWFLDVVSFDFRSDDKLSKSQSAVDTVCDLFHLDVDWRKYFDDDDQRPLLGTDDQEDAKRDEAHIVPAMPRKKKQRKWYGGGPVGGGRMSRRRTLLTHEVLAFRLLTARGWRELTRNRSALAFKWIMQAFFSVMFGLCYFNLGLDQTSIQNRSGILFFTAMNISFGGPIGVSQIVPAQLKVINAERASRLYCEFSYLLSVFVVNLPLESVPQIISASVMYFMVNLRPGLDHFLTYVGVLIAENFVGIGLGLALSVALSKPEMAGQIAPAVAVLFLMFSGYFLQENSIPVFIRWLKYISFVRYTFQALAVNEFRGVAFHCGHAASDAVCVTKGGLVLKQLGFDDVHIVTNVLILVAMIFLFNLAALLIFACNRPRFLPWSVAKKKKGRHHQGVVATQFQV